MTITEDRFTNILDYTQREIGNILTSAWHNGTLDKVLEPLGLSNLLPHEAMEYWNDTLSRGKILIIGESSIKEREIMSSLKSIGISKDRVELRLGYDAVKRFDIGQLQYNPEYRLILVGPMPHKTVGTGDYSSPLSRMEREAGFPKVVRMCSNEELKITKSNLKQIVNEQIMSGYLAA